ncbi:MULTISPECIES: DUF4128 domain-containing protein [Methylorubrum]|uniref:DUF4128 domain-containing protein n=1 Tax=Methylorubrum TaxID=2282523 RepID=UPI0020A1F75C|nr:MULTISPECIES: DUF4128 domain-containing protein [Methylorubrum]MCP1550712.1 hypothetical protein [Methylorubrum zatmanii]MCP1552675.1 hypothetical protein [Methylorubrum extorquens]MCP1581015.1 hypothetical protein [Methylorubrum extorquens]
MPVTGAEAKIYDALMAAAVAAGEAAGFPAKTGIALPNVGFTPPKGAGGKRKEYLSVTYMPNGASLDGLPFDSDETHIGLLQVSVFWPSGDGIVKPLEAAALIVDAFPPGRAFERNGIVVRIDVLPTVAGPLQESDLVQIPVTIRWRAGIAADA